MENKRSTLKKISIVLLIIISILFIGFFVLKNIYDNHFDIADKYQDKYDIALPYDIENNDDIRNYLSYSKEDPYNLSIDIPKEYFYSNMIDINEVVEDIYQMDEIRVNKMGVLSSQDEENTADVYLDAIYKDKLNCFIKANVKYEVIENNKIKLSVSSIQIGDGSYNDLIKKLFKINDKYEISTIDLSNIDLVKNNILMIDMLENLDITSNNINCDYDLQANLNNISLYIFKDENTLMNLDDNLIPDILDLLFNKNLDSLSDISSIVQSLIINNKLNDVINNIFSLFF